MRIGIDLGGTKIEIIALDEAGAVLCRERTPTPQGDYPATLAAVVNLVRATEARLGRQGSVGVGLPGAVSAHTGRIKNANSTCLNGRDVQGDLSAALGRPVRLANDANCFALSEAADGAGKGAAVVFGVILGTGVGGGIVVRGQLIEGVNRIAGEWGHNPLPGEASALPRCYCGRLGCIETFLSGPGMEQDHLRQGGAPLKAHEIARSNDPACRATIARYSARLARALAGVINLLDPDVIVLGGGLSSIDSLYAAVPSAWGAQVFSDVIDTRLVRNVHGDSSGVRGAAWLWQSS
jgi:predicted NBD/HSP70 family sugar kinase